jgi:UTP--glucose-1-phosphate uridylyltransferase
MTAEEIERSIRQKMNARGIPGDVIDDFLARVRQVAGRVSSYIPLDSVRKPGGESVLDIDPVRDDIRDLSELGKSLLDKLVVLKLNGGRSTTMGGLVPKGIITAKDDRTYLDIIVGQMRALHRETGVDVPLGLMNSFFTNELTLEELEENDYPVFSFVQNEVPRLQEDSLMPVETGDDEDWAPAGHGDILPSLKLRGVLKDLLDQGKKWAFISNIDNLAAVVETWILGLMASHSIKFLMEVTDRTDEDRKGGTLVVKDGNLCLLEIAQVAPEERERFMDIDQFSVFNTNNIWIDLEALDQVLESLSLSLPTIRNVKTLLGQRIIQLETAVGAAICSFPDAKGLRVGRDRFFPTKTVADLFVLQSDACILDERDRLIRNPKRSDELSLRPKVVFGQDLLDSPLRLGSRFADIESISLVMADHFEISGHVFFERNVTIKGTVKIMVPPGGLFRIKSGTILMDGTYSEM